MVLVVEGMYKLIWDAVFEQPKVQRQQSRSALRVKTCSFPFPVYLETPICSSFLGNI